MFSNRSKNLSQEEVGKVGRWSIIRISAHLVLILVIVIFPCGPFVGESAPVTYDMTSRHYNCSDICEYDDWFDRAQCEERRLSQVPFSTGCTNAVMLEIQENNIGYLTMNCLTGYKKLRTLDASRNNISTIDPGALVCVPRLRNLLLSHNKLTELSNGTFTGVENHLQRIYLNHNELTYIDEDAFKNLSNVVLLFLSHNNIETLPPRVFYGMSKLRYLHVGKNKLHIIHQSIFRSLNSLESIDLHNNKLRWIPEGLFDGLPSLREVVLSGNHIISLPIPKGHMRYELFDVADNKLNQSGVILPYLSISERIYIDGNPFICNCDFQKVQQWYQNKTPTELQPYEIRNPIICEEYDIEEVIPLSCDLSNATDNTVRKLPTTQPTFDVPVSNSRKHEYSSTTEAEPTVTTKFLTSRRATNISPVSLSEIDNKIFALSIYITIVATLLLLLWVIRTLYVFCLMDGPEKHDDGINGDRELST